jgi:hypothetical protein
MVSDAVIVIVGIGLADVVGATVVGATVVGATVVGATVVGATVVGATVVGATVVGATVVGATVVGATVVGATVVGATVVGVAELLVLPAAGVVGVTPDAEVDGCTTGPTVVVVVGLTRALMIGERPVTVPDCFADWPPIALGFELPLALAWAAAGDSPGSAVAAGQAAALQAMNALDDLDCDALVPYQQIRAIAPRTPVPTTRFRTECGRW